MATGMPGAGTSRTLGLTRVVILFTSWALVFVHAAHRAHRGAYANDGNDGDDVWGARTDFDIVKYGAMAGGTDDCTGESALSLCPPPKTAMPCPTGTCTL